MKKQFYILLICLSLCILTMSGCSDNSINANTESKPLQLTLNEAFEEYLHSNNITGDIIYFTSNTYTGDDTQQAFALVGTNDSADLWYTDAETTEKLVGQIAISEAPTVVTTSSKPMYIVDGVNDKNVRESYAYTVIDGRPLRLSGHGEDLTSMGGDDFFTVVSTTDKILSNGNLKGESHKKYYLCFDGSSLKEYGGIKISETEFMKLNKSDTILAEISDCGYTITDFIYRANGLININCEKTVDGETRYENLTIKVIKNNCICIPTGQAQDADYVGRSSYGGKYEYAAFPDIATYPEEFVTE